MFRVWYKENPFYFFERGTFPFYLWGVPSVPCWSSPKFVSCYSLNPKCPPYVQCYRLCPLCSYWEVVECLRGRAWWQVYRSLGACPWRELWDSRSFLSLAFLPWSERFHSITCSCLAQDQKQWSCQLWTGNSKTVSQKKPFVNLLSQAFVTVMERWADTWVNSSILHQAILPELSSVCHLAVVSWLLMIFTI